MVLLRSVLQHQVFPVREVTIQELVAHLGGDIVVLIIPYRLQVSGGHFQGQPSVGDGGILDRSGIFHITIIHPFYVVHKVRHTSHGLITGVAVVSDGYFRVISCLGLLGRYNHNAIRGA